MFFTPFYFSETHFTPPLPIKVLAVLDRTRKVDFFFPSNCASTHFCPFVVPDKADLLVQSWAFCAPLLFFCSAAPAVHILYCRSQLCGVLLLTAITNFILFCATFLSFLSSYLLLTTLPSTRIFLFLHYGGERSRLVNISFSSAALFHSQMSYHRHAEITRGEEILA